MSQFLHSQAAFSLLMFFSIVAPLVAALFIQRRIDREIEQRRKRERGPIE